jgi:uncharacterized protein YciI
MNKCIVAALMLVFSIRSAGQADKSRYDKALADSLGADEYGMKMYVFVILKTGENKTEDKIIKDSLFRGHMNNIGRLARMGKLVVAGPFGQNKKEFRGLFILNVKTIEEAKTLLETDPAIKAKIFETELFQWYGSAALPLYLKYEDAVRKKSF